MDPDNMAKVKEYATKFVSFLNKSPSPFHAVHECKQLLAAAGFSELKEQQTWDLKPNGKYFLTTNYSSIFAFAVGGKYKPGNGFSIIAAHTDSPGFKLKPNSQLTSQGYLTVGVQSYGGGIWRSWYDRDLTVAGKVFVRDETRIRERLVFVQRPIMCITSLAIHLSRDSNDAFKHNVEDNMRPVIATKKIDELNKPAGATEKSADSGNAVPPEKIPKCGKHHSLLINLIAKELNSNPEDIVDLELILADCQPAQIGGIHEEFVFSGRLDNLLSTFTTVLGIIECVQDAASLSNDTNIRFAACYDHEEIGSESAQGARTNKTYQYLRRITYCPGLNGNAASPTALDEAFPKSIIISTDQAHAVHPNHAAKHEENHRPALHGGIVIKVNANNRYATNGFTHTVMKEVASLADVPLQPFVVRNDSPCGSTVGPPMSAKLGIQTVDLGCPQLAMHSIREMCCTSSVMQAIKFFKKFYEAYPGIQSRMDIL